MHSSTANASSVSLSADVGSCRQTFYCFCLCVHISDGAATFEVADSEPSSSDSGVPSSCAGSPHQILEFFEMCCALITTLAK